MFKTSGIISQRLKLSTLAEKLQQADVPSQVDSFSEIDPARAFPFDKMNSLRDTITDTLSSFPSSEFNSQLTNLQSELSSTTPDKMSQILSFSNVDTDTFTVESFPLDIGSLSSLGGATKGLNNSLAGGSAAIKNALNSSQSLSDFSAGTLDVESIGKSVVTSIQGVSSQAKALAAESAAPLSSIAGGMSGSLVDSPTQFSGGDIESFLKQLSSNNSSDVEGLSENIESIVSSIAPGFSGLGNLKSITEQSVNDLADTAKAKADGLDNLAKGLNSKVDVEPNNLSGIKKFLVSSVDSINAYADPLNKKIKEANTAGVAKIAAQNNPEATPVVLESAVKNSVGRMNKQDDAKFKTKVSKAEDTTKKTSLIINDLLTTDAGNETESLLAGRQHADKPTLISIASQHNNTNKIYTMYDVEQLFLNVEGNFSYQQLDWIEQGLKIINSMPIPNMRKLAFDSLKLNTKTLQYTPGFWHGLLYYPIHISDNIDKPKFIINQQKLPPEKRKPYGSHWSHYGVGFFFRLVEFNLNAYQHAPNSRRALTAKDSVQIVPSSQRLSDKGTFFFKKMQTLYTKYESNVNAAGGPQQYATLLPNGPIPIPPETWLAHKGYAVNGSIAEKLESYGLKGRRIREGAPYWMEPAVVKGIDPLQFVNKNGTLNYDAVNDLLGSVSI